MPQADHYRRACPHGVMISQCRCPGPKVHLLGACPPACEHYGKWEAPYIGRPAPRHHDEVEVSTEVARSQRIEEERYARMQEAEL